MNDITANVPFLIAWALVSAIYWPITFAIAAAAIAGVVRSKGFARFVFALIALVFAASWVIGWSLLHE